LIIKVNMDVTIAHNQLHMEEKVKNNQVTKERVYTLKLINYFFTYL